jgi:hypothetical protein
MMERYTLFVAAALAFSVSQAQLVTVTDEQGNVMNSTLVVVNGLSSDEVIDRGFTTLLNGDVAKTVDMVRYEIDPVMGTANYFCWGECWLPQAAGAQPTWEAISAVNLAPGVANNGFHAYYNPEGLEACANFRFVWFDSADPDDSVWVDVRFCAEAPIGIQEERAPAFSMSPNPAVGQNVQFSLDMNGSAQTDLVIYSVLGERVRAHRLSKDQSRFDLSTSGLAPGVYFAALERNGRALNTQRLVVQR